MTSAVRTAVVLPVKRLDQAKHRLSGALAPGARRALMAAMLGDVLAALAEVATPHEVLMVTADEAAARLGSRAGAVVVADTGAPGHSNAAALGVAAAMAGGARRVLMMAGDCPMARADEIEALLVLPKAPAGRVIVVPDRAGTGTNALLLEPPGAIAPSFGPGSHRRHLDLAHAAGVPAETRWLTTLMLDVDTPDDLVALRAALDASPEAAGATAGTLARLAAAVAATP